MAGGLGGKKEGSKNSADPLLRRRPRDWNQKGGGALRRKIPPSPPVFSIAEKASLGTGWGGPRLAVRDSPRQLFNSDQKYPHRGYFKLGENACYFCSEFFYIKMVLGRLRRDGLGLFTGSFYVHFCRPVLTYVHGFACDCTIVYFWCTATSMEEEKSKKSYSLA